MAKRGKVSLIDNKRALAAFLEKGDFSGLSWYSKQKLLANKYITVTTVKTGKKGRPSEVVTVSGKGNGLIGLSKKWVSKQSVA